MCREIAMKFERPAPPRQAGFGTRPPDKRRAPSGARVIHGFEPKFRSSSEYYYLSAVSSQRF